MDKRQIRQLISDDKNPIIFECGAAQGSDTLEFIQAFDDLEFNLYAFEPDNRNIPVFKSVIKDPRVHLFEGVIGNIDGDVDFYTSTHNPITGQEFIHSSSLMLPDKGLFETWPVFVDESTFVKETKKSVTLDTFCEMNEIYKVSFAWVDLQGAEKLLIEGGRRAFERHVRYFYFECNNKGIYKGAADLSEIMQMLPNYELIQDFGTDALLLNKNWSKYNVSLR